MPRSKPPSLLAFALLSLIARRSRSGYDLAQLLAPPVNLLWPVHHSQIYPELKRLAEAGFIQGRRISQEERPDRIVYSLTPAGRERFRDWVVAPARAATIKIEAAVKAHGSWLVDPATFDGMLEAHRAQVREEIRRLSRHWQDFQKRRNALASTGELRRQALGTFAAFRLSLAVRSAQLEWCDWLAAALEDPEGADLDFAAMADAALGEGRRPDSDGECAAVAGRRR